MANGLERLIECLPDVWFDWYARLMPGCFGILVYLYLSSSIPCAPNGVDLIFFLLLGYGLGHVLQPLAGVLVKLLEGLYGKERRYAEARQNPNTRLFMLKSVSKAHAEANSMLAFGIALFLNMVWFWSSPKLNRLVAIIGLVYFVLAATLRTRARDRKIRDLL